MIYNYNNKDEINDLYIHDSFFTGFSYDYIKRSICFDCKHYYQGIFSFAFNNVIYYSVQSCLFWGNGNRILDISFEEKSIELQKLMELQNSDPKQYEYSELDENKHFISISFTLNSGDTILIICESFELDNFPEKGQGKGQGTVSVKTEGAEK